MLVGEAPSPKAVLDELRGPLYGNPARTLTGIMEGVPAPDDRAAYECLSDRFECVNVLPVYPGEKWPREDARYAVKHLIRDAGEGRTFVLLGRRVADAFCLGDCAYFHWYELRYGNVCVLPHPSGLNRLLNDPKIREQMGIALGEAIARAKETIG